MTQELLVASAVKKLESQIERLQEALQGLSEEQFNREIKDCDWSLAGVVDHMILSHGPYLRLVTPLIDSSEGSTGKEPKPTFLGKMIAKMAGPDGNAPAPKSMAPNRSRYDLRIVDQWLELHQEILAVMKRADESNLQQKFESPFLPLVKMNLTDFFLIVPAHTERHVRQLEARRRFVVHD